MANLMQVLLLISSITVFVLTFWLGIYLLHRDYADPRLRWTGIGLVLYAMVVAVLFVQATRPRSGAEIWSSQFWWLLSLPAVAWTGAAVHLLPDGSLHTHLQRFWLYGEAPLVLLLAPLFIVVGATGDDSVARWLHIVLAIAVLSPLVVTVVAIGRTGWKAEPRRLSALLLVAAIFFALSVGALLLPVVRFDPTWLVLAMGGDLLLIGVAICGTDAFDQGESLLPDLLLSLDGALLYAGIFGGLVVATMLVETGITPGMLALLLATMASAICVHVLASPIQRGLDQLALGRQPQLREARSVLRDEGDALPRQPSTSFVDANDDKSFDRLTRRALSQMNDLGKLAQSPLTGLSCLEPRLGAADLADNSTTRAQELRALLAEAIAEMKPPGNGDFGTTGQWRYYNSLYYPYVVGLRPYSRRTVTSGLDATSEQALAWFREQVPERTLYNWQRSGAQWVARYLRELEQTVDPDAEDYVRIDREM